MSFLAPADPAPGPSGHPPWWPRGPARGSAGLHRPDAAPKRRAFGGCGLKHKGYNSYNITIYRRKPFQTPILDEEYDIFLQNIGVKQVLQVYI